MKLLTHLDLSLPELIKLGDFCFPWSATFRLHRKPAARLTRRMMCLYGYIIIISAIGTAAGDCFQPFKSCYFLSDNQEPTETVPPVDKDSDQYVLLKSNKE